MESEIVSKVEKFFHANENERDNIRTAEKQLEALKLYELIIKAEIKGLRDMQKIVFSESNTTYDFGDNRNVEFSKNAIEPTMSFFTCPHSKENFEKSESCWFVSLNKFDSHLSPMYDIINNNNPADRAYFHRQIDALKFKENNYNLIF